MIYKKSRYLLIILVGIVFLFPMAANAKGKGTQNKKMAKISGGQIATTRIDINQINSLESNQGFSDYNLNSNLEGAEYPKGSGKNFVFTAGFIWGGIVNGDTSHLPRVGGTTYNTGLEPGPIINGLPAPNPNGDSRWSIYRVRSDVYPGGPSVDLSGDAIWEGNSASAIRSQYESDWTNWPAAGTSNNLGAPFTDVNGDGKYEPGIDIPGVPGADQTVFYVANDLDTNLTTGLYGALPMGMELHVTFWAYAQQGPLGNMYFKKWELINKGKNTIDSMFVSFWTDVDLGYAGDDLVGCDTTLSMQFTYNGQSTDQVYAPLPPPADGFTFFQGPIVPGQPTDSAISIGQPFVFRYTHGVKNLPMTAAYFFVNGDAHFGDPPLGQPSGSTQFYNFMNGNYGLTNAPFLDNNGKETKFAFYGDPVAGTGWLDGVALPPGDRRQGMASGPFTFAPGDTQQVVIAEMVAGALPTVDYLQAVSLVKVYDKTAQNAFNNFFSIPKAPPAPHVQVDTASNKIVLDWGENSNYVSATENSVVIDKLDSLDASGGGAYKFEGYNVYQLPYAGASISQAKRLATYDLIDSVKDIPYIDLSTRQINPSYYIQYGTDSGIQRYFVDSTDAFNSNKPLINGLNYYFAVTAYSYNPKGVPQSLENPISQIIVQPQSIQPGVTPPTVGPLPKSSVTHSGTADATASVNIVGSSQTTGDQYQISFHNELYSLGSNAVWTDVTPPSKKLAKVTDLTGSSLSTTAVWNETKGQFAIHYLVSVVSPDYDYCEGVMLTLPAGIAIDSIISPVSNNSKIVIPYTFNRSTNTIFFGDSSLSANGIFAGGEDITIIAHNANLPILTNYTMYDDGYGVSVDTTHTDLFPVNVHGVDSTTTIASQLVTQHQWNVTDLKTGNVVLKNQTIYGGVDIYSPATYFLANNIYGPGGSSYRNGGNNLGVSAAIFDGITVNVNGSFVAPTTLGNVILNGNALTIDASFTYNASSGNYAVNDFTDFGYNGTAAASLYLYNGGVTVGATDINTLQQDYELKWTGVTGDTTINGHTVLITKSGGSYATLFGASNYSIANHPLNPNPGVKKSFLIRIPFEVWNRDKNEQVNLLVYDRNFGKTNDPTKDGFEVWNENDRVYVWVVNTKYSAAVIDPTSSIVADSATWNWVFFKSIFKTGDDLKIVYNNPLQIGKDTFTFTVPKTSYSSTQAKQDVTQINVFPNPYYGVNSQETSKYARYVTFNHLPPMATIHLFNLAGVMVKTIYHTNGTQFQQWDLTNDSGLPVASGLYIAYIDMPTLGTTKILKLAIIQEQQYPDHF